MFLPVYWGKKKTETRLGFAADYCAVCRRITAFGIDRITEAFHAYFVPVEKGRFIGHTQICLSCQLDFESFPGRFNGLAETSCETIDRLALETHPSVYQDFAERLALGARIAADPHAFDPDLRKKLLMEPFQIASPFFEDRGRETGLRVLITALRPLDPSEDEVRECLNHFRRIGARIAVMIRTATVMRTLTWKPSAHQYDY
jgi:hypothetical protein